MSSSIPTLSGEAAKALADSSAQVTFVFVLGEDHFARGHIPGSVQASVYEVSFFDKIKGAGITTETSLVVYGIGGKSLDSKVAAEKLVRAGYTQVQDLREGLDAWKAAGGALEGSGEDDPLLSAGPSGSFAIDLEKSKLIWSGRNLGSLHHGTIAFASGEVALDAGQLAGGEVVADLKAMTCEDITDENLAGILIAHLQSDDFFDTELFPTARIRLTNAEALHQAQRTDPNFRVHADLTIRDVTLPITFGAGAAMLPDGKTFALEAHLDFDRTRWGVLYGSGRFFAGLGQNMVGDTISLQVFLVVDTTEA